MKKYFLLTYLFARTISNVYSSDDCPYLQPGYLISKKSISSLQKTEKLLNTLERNIFIATDLLIKQGFSYYQAEDAVNKRLHSKTALYAKNNNRLETLEKKVARYQNSNLITQSQITSTVNFLTRFEQDQTKRTHQVVALLQEKLPFNQASIAQYHGCATKEQAQLLFKNNPDLLPKNNFEIEIIIKK